MRTLDPRKFLMLTERFARDRDELPKTDETVRDAVWNRLGVGGIALPGAVTSIAALVMSEKRQGRGWMPTR